MATPRSTVAESELRTQRIARIIASGGKRSDCLRFAAEQWGISTRQTETYIARARDLIKADWAEIHRDQMIADLLSQYSTLQMEARRTGHLNVALGCIHGAARLAQLVS
jgi:hypothetical protein